MNNVLGILENAARQWPEKVALYDAHGSLTFTQLYNQANTLKEALLAQGVSKGQGIGVRAKNSREFVIGLFGASGTGAVVMPLSHQLKPQELTTIIAESGLHYIVHDEQVEGNIIMGDFSFYTTKNPKTETLAPHVKEAAFIRFTSGTTGKAKGVVLSFPSVLERVKGAQRAMQLSADDVVVWVLPMAYHFVASIVLYVYCGASLVIAENFMAPTVLGAINKYRGTLLYASPMHLRILAADDSEQGMPSMQKVISTSTGISKEVCQNFTQRYQLPVIQAYGIIEIGLPLINLKNAHEHPVSVGLPTEGYGAEIINDKGEILPNGSVGHLALAGPGMFDAYLNPPIPKTEVLTNDLFVTSDFAEKNTEGLIFIKGRKKSVINVSGNKVFPEEVEHLVNTRPEIAQCRISGVPHPIMGQIVQAEIVLAPGQDIEVEELISFCRKNLSTYKIPQRVLKVASIEMTDSGKVKR